MANIVDQRAFFGATSVKDIHEKWREHLARANERRIRERLDPLQLVDDSSHQRVAAYVNHSRWVADCPTCGAGMMTWPDHQRACCLGCFHIVSVQHPSKARIGQVLPLLLERSDPRTRNWDHVDAPAARQSDPKQLDRARWREDDDVDTDGWESTRRIRNENRLIGGLPGDGRGDERDLIASPGQLGKNGAPSIDDVTLPERGKRNP